MKNILFIALIAILSSCSTQSMCTQKKFTPSWDIEMAQRPYGLSLDQDFTVELNDTIYRNYSTKKHKSWIEIKNDSIYQYYWFDESRSIFNLFQKSQSTFWIAAGGLDEEYLDVKEIWCRSDLDLEPITYYIRHTPDSILQFRFR